MPDASLRPTLGSKLDRRNGFAPGFDLMRVALAAAIFLAHTLWIAGSPQGTPAPATAVQGWTGPTRPFYIMLVPMFFALSGFLIAGSAFRLKNVKTYIIFRSLRIFPALCVEVTLSALLLGPIFTTLPLADYFSDKQFLRYFGNILGFVTFQLPGVFLHNPVADKVNINLWTLRGEFYSYLIIMAAMATGLFYDRARFTRIFMLSTALCLILSLTQGAGVTWGVYPSHVIVYYSLAGCLFFHWKDHIPFGWGYFVLASLAAYLLLLNPITVYVAPLFLVYATVALGVMELPRMRWLERGDYSYGIYLYGFPIAQGLVAMLPAWRGHGIWVLTASTALTLLFAVTSWHCIEHPILRLKKRFSTHTLPRPAN